MSGRRRRYVARLPSDLRDDAKVAAGRGWPLKRYGVGVRWGVIAVILCACMLVPAGQASTADVTFFSTNPAWVANSGWQYSFRVTVRNTGSDAVHVVLRETLDPRERMDWNFLENHGSSPVCTSTPTIDCDLGMLDPGASATVIFEAQVDGTAPGTVTHTASVDGGANETSSMPVRERSTTDLNVLTQDAAGARRGLLCGIPTAARATRPARVASSTRACAVHFRRARAGAHDGAQPGPLRRRHRLGRQRVVRGVRSLGRHAGWRCLP